MELRAYQAVLRRRIWVILVTLVVAVAVALAGTVLAARVYVATATVRVSVTSGSLDYITRDSAYADRLINTYASIGRSQAVLQQLVDQLQLPAPPRITVTAPANSELMRISAEDSDPDGAARIANAAADILVGQAREDFDLAQSAQTALRDQLALSQEALYQARLKYETLSAQPLANPEELAAARADLDVKQQAFTSLLSQYDRARITALTRSDTITVVDPAVPPESPSKPNAILNLSLGLLAGLIGGVGLAFLFENVDDRLHTVRGIRQATGGPILALIPAARRQRGLLNSSNPQVLEALRRLRTTLLARYHGLPLRTLLVTSSERDEGRSTVVANLAVALARADRKVLVIDADLRAPALHRIFDLPNEVGLVNVLRQEATLDEAIRETRIPQVYLLPSGPEPPNPPELLGSVGMKVLLRQIEDRFDLTLIDTPALGQVTDAAVLANVVDGVILVVARGRARAAHVRATVYELATIQARLAGVVVNRARPDDDLDRGLSADHLLATTTDIGVLTSVDPLPRRNGRPKEPAQQRLQDDGPETTSRPG